MASEQQTYSGGGVSIAGLIEHLGREAARLNAVVSPVANRQMPPMAAFQSNAQRGQVSGAVRTSPAPQGVQYGRLYAPPAVDLAELRRQQAAFARAKREIDEQNRWLAIPALAPVAVPFLVEGGATALASRARPVNLQRGPLHLVDGEPWWRSVQKAARLARDARDTAIRVRGRVQFARANGISPRKLEAQVHHSDPLEWAHLKPNADPNRLANLWAIKKQHHIIANREWAAFKRSLQGRTPSQAELMEVKLRIDRMLAPYVLRAGVSRARPPKLKPGEPR